MTKTIERLREQHQIVLARLDEVEAAVPGSLATMGEFLAFLQTELPEHFDLEETVLFPVLSRHRHLADGPVAVMEAEHHECHALVAELAVALRAGSMEQLAAVARRVVAVLRAHIDKEDHVLFPLAARVLSAAERDEVEARAAQRPRSAPEPETVEGRCAGAARM